MEKLELFKKMDSKIFEEAEKLDMNPEINKARDLYINANDQSKEYIKYISFALFYALFQWLALKLQDSTMDQPKKPY